MTYPPHPNWLMNLTPLFLLLFSPIISISLSASIVTHLPGFQGPLPFYLETGYVGVDEVNGAELFYYFIESERSPREDPLILWLTGGPRCSAFSGLVFEIGPMNFVSVQYNGSLPELVYHPYSWTKISNIIFLDSPVGSGFSFSRRSEGYNAGDLSWSNHVHTFLMKWMGDHPRFLSNPLYIAGDSYAGKVVPVIVQQIADGVESGIKPVLNLKGYLIGNPSTGEKVDYNSQVPYAHGVGIISDQLFEMTQKNCEGQDYRSPNTERCAFCVDAVNKFLSEIDKSDILAPSCAFASPRPRANIRDGRTVKGDYLRLLEPPLVPELGCRSYAYMLSYYWANSDVVRAALRIKKGTVREWQRCNFGLPYTADVSSSIKFHLNVTSRGYRALVYSGDHDMLVPFVGTKEWIRSLNFKVVDKWRSWHVRGQVAGYVTTYSNNLTFTTVKGAGHTAPEYRPKQCLAMVERWISYQPL